MLRAEHTHLLNVLAGGPRDRTNDLKQLTAEIQGLHRKLADATARRDEAVAQLEDMGPVGKHIHRRVRTRLEDQIVQTDAIIDAITAKIAERSAIATGYGTDVRRRRSWAVEREPECDRLKAVRTELESRIAPPTIRNRPVERDDLGVGL